MNPYPEILTDGVTAATTNVAAEYTVVPAPGAGERIRVFGMDFTFAQGAVGTTRIRGSVICGTSNRVLGRFEIVANDMPSDHIDFAGTAGVPLDENDALAVNAVCTIAGPTDLFMAVRYLVETV